MRTAWALSLLPGLAWGFVAQQRPPREAPRGGQAPQELQEPKQAPEIALPSPPPPGLLPLHEIAQIETAAFPKGPVLFHEGAVVVVSRDGVVGAYNADDGQLRWRLGFPEQDVLAPKPLREGLLLSLADGSLFVVETASGAISREISVPASLGIAPLPDDGVYYLASPDGEILAYDLGTGQLRWRAHSGEPTAALAKSGGLLVVSGARGTLTGIEARNGRVRWKRRTRGVVMAPAVFDAESEKLYIGDAAGTFYCLSTDKGKEHYRWETGAAIADPALVEDDRVYVASFANTLFAYRAGNGHELWRVDLPGRPASPPVRVRRRLVLATQDGLVVEVDPTRGRRIPETYQAPSSIRPGAVIHPPYVALTLFMGKVLLLETAPPPLPATETKEARPDPTKQLPDAP